MEPRHWTIIDGYQHYHCNNIEADLCRLGATAREADGLTDILHFEGWGELAGDPDPSGRFSDDYLKYKILWYRDFRAQDAEVR